MSSTASHSPATNTEASTSSQRELANKKGLRPWLFIWLAFALQITAWVFWVKLASKHPVQEVPLVTAQPPTETSQLGRDRNASSPHKTGLRPRAANEQPAQ